MVYIVWHHRNIWYVFKGFNLCAGFSSKESAMRYIQIREEWG